MTRAERFCNSWWTVSAALLFLVAVLYFNISTGAYNWRHPELTRMQVLRYHLSDALRWES